jgi:hypothetical protein
MIKFFSVDLGGAKQLREQLAAARAAHETRLRMFEAIAAEHYSEPVDDMPRWKQSIFLTLQLGMARERAWLDWAKTSAGIIAKWR